MVESVGMNGDKCLLLTLPQWKTLRGISAAHETAVCEHTM